MNVIVRSRSNSLTTIPQSNALTIMPRGHLLENRVAGLLCLVLTRFTFKCFGIILFLSQKKKKKINRCLIKKRKLLRNARQLHSTFSRDQLTVKCPLFITISS